MGDRTFIPIPGVSTFSSISISATATLMSSYIPPLATGPPSAGGVAATTSTMIYTPNPTTPALADDLSWIRSYMWIHMLSKASYRYPFILWVLVGIIFIMFALLHWTGSRGGWIGAYWTKWSLRRRTWRKRHTLAIARRTNQPHRQPFAFPSNAQMLALTVLIVGVILLCVVGPDQVDPNVPVFDLTRTSKANKRDFDPSVVSSFRPNYAIYKSFWTAGNRTGDIAYALFPLCILFVLKAPPFAIFALPFMIQLHFDKLVRLHRWSGRLIWLVTAIHVGLWTTQLCRDRRPGVGTPAVHYAWMYDKFQWGFTAFILLTLTVVCSLRPIRTHYYDAFYAMHLVLVPATLITAALHHPPIWWWIWAALGLWIGERVWRFVWYVYVNAYFTRTPVPSASHFAANQPSLTPFSGVDKMGRPTNVQTYETEAWEMGRLQGDSIDVENQRLTSPTRTKRDTVGSRMSVSDSPTARLLLDTSFTAEGAYVPPPGFAHCVLLPGRTVRMRIITPGYLTWAPGQHFLIKIPTLSDYTTHPFTVASVCDDQAPSDSDRAIVLLVRAKAGWTKRLWDEVVSLLSNGLALPEEENLPQGYQAPAHGVVMRTLVDGPFGSSVRARWGSYSTVLIVAGGSGVSFGLSVLQYMCMCMSGRDGKFLGGRPGGWGHAGFRTQRVRFVWLVREFSHIQWCASAIRHCMELIPDDSLEISIYVTNFKPSASQAPLMYSLDDSTAHHLAPPTPQFAKRSRRESNSSTTSVDSIDSAVSLNYAFGGKSQPDEHGRIQEGDPNGELGHEEDILDYTNFDGDDDTVMPGETALSQKLKKEGKMRRAKTRKAKSALAAKQHLEVGGTGQGRRDRASTFSAAEQTLTSPDGHYLSPTDGPQHHRRSSLGRELDEHGHRSGSGGDNMRSPSPAPSHNKHSTSGHQRPLSSGSSYPGSMPGSRPTSFLGDQEKMSIKMDGMKIPMKGKAEEITLEMDPQEARDLKIISELARPGRPKMDKVLKDEVLRSHGAIVVGCCGPASLNAIMRKAIASEIDPKRVRDGDLRGSISFVSEEFEY